MSRKMSAYSRKRANHGARAASNPVCNGLKAKKYEEDFKSQIATTKLKIMMADDGDDATELLAALSVVIGTPCEAGSRQEGRVAPWVRQLHGALRIISSLCTEHGYTWRSEYALAFDRAVEVAEEHQGPLDKGVFALAWVEASAMAEAILKHQFSGDQVAATIGKPVTA